MNYDLTDLEECILKIQDDDESTECSSDELVTVFLAYQENYQEYFPEETELLPFITNASSSSTAGWNFRFWFQINEDTELNESLVKTYRDIYKTIVEDFESLLKDNVIWLNFLITTKDRSYDIQVSYINDKTEENNYSNVLIFSEYYETVTLEDVEESFSKWKYFIDLDGFWLKGFCLGLSWELRKGLIINFYNNSTNENLNYKFEFGGSSQYSLSDTDVERIILENTRGYTLLEREE
jgi:hypothetical protein